jgi:hypothetical protein
MNELVNQLADQAKNSVPRGVLDPDMWIAEYNRIFAELIVRECMRMCEVAEMSFVTHDCDVEASGAITVKQFIAEHFGVEE